MNQDNIEAYLRENKDKYSEEVLTRELLKAGYHSDLIIAGVKNVYDGVQVGNSINFFDFKTKAIYGKTSDRVGDFCLGILGFVAMVIVLFFTSIYVSGNYNNAWARLLPFIFIIFYIFCLVYFFNRRRFIFYGLMFWIFVLIVLFSFSFIDSIF